MVTLELIASGYSLLEVPRWHAGSLWVADLYEQRVLAFSADGAPRQALDVPGVPVGLAFGPDERLVVLTQDGLLLRHEQHGFQEIARGLRTGPAACNELTIDQAGRAFIGVFGLTSGSLLRVDPDGTVHRAADQLLLPNGQAISNRQTLLVAESAGQRVSAFDIADDGTLTNRRIWCSFGEPATATDLRAVFGQVQTWPDGIALDAENGLWVADPVGRQLLRVHGGAVTDRIATGELACQACALGGPDGRTLFVCATPSAPDPAAYRSRRDAQLLRYLVQTPAHSA